MIRWCRTCVLPDTRPNLVIGDDGICSACRTSTTKPAVDWDARAAAFRRLVARVKGSVSGHDCVIPVSGGKDSTWQVVTCLEHGLTPLAVTWRPPGRTALGQANLDNLIRLGVDHIDVSIAPETERRFTLAAFERFGTPALPMHMAIFNIPVMVAVRFGIPLVVWGENSAVEYGDGQEDGRGVRLDADWLARYGVTHGTVAADWVGEGLSRKALASYFGPTPAEAAAAGVEAVFLGHYFPFDTARNAAVAAAHGFRARTEGARTGYWDYADVDDAFISVHHWMKWYKFGFTRTFDNLSFDIRKGRITRAAAIEILRARGDETPHEDVRAFSTFLGIDEGRFMAIAERFRNPGIWRRDEAGVWRIDHFLVADWTWS